jgi:mannose/fructose/N-acetylgalactosamine-specific phosphotransferase system component IID
MKYLVPYIISNIASSLINVSYMIYLLSQHSKVTLVTHWSYGMIYIFIPLAPFLITKSVHSLFKVEKNWSSLLIGMLILGMVVNLFGIYGNYTDMN